MVVMVELHKLCVDEARGRSRANATPGVEEKRRLNELTPIGQLPSELLVEVLIYRSGLWHSREFSWIEVSHVCHRWREVALQCPMLWSKIYTRSPQRTREMLLCSKQAALDVVVSDNRNRDERQVILLLLLELHRMRSIEIVYRICCCLNNPNIPKFAPLLCSITIEAIPSVIYCPQPYSIDWRHRL